MRSHLVAHVEQQRARPAGKVQHIVELSLLAGAGVLAIQRNNARENAGDRLRSIELPCLFTGASGELANQVLVGIAQYVAVGGELGYPFGDLGDDGARSEERRVGKEWRGQWW